MRPLPQPIQTYLARHMDARHQAAFLMTDAEGRVSAWGGMLEAYPLGSLSPGVRAEDHLLALIGYFPFAGDPVELPGVELAPGSVADVHLFSAAPDQVCVLLLDTTEPNRMRQALLQRVNDLNLLRTAQHKIDATTGAMFAAMGILALEQKPDGHLAYLGDRPAWYLTLCRHLNIAPEAASFVDRLAFVQHFLMDAEAFWDRQETGIFKSGPWQEEGLPADYYLEASALCLHGRRVLLIDRAKMSLTEKKQLLQTGREHRLAHHKLLKDIEKKEILLHCIVHDLSGPLGGIQAGLALLNAEKFSNEGRAFLDLCLKQSNKLAMFIREILDAFSAEVQPFDPAALDPAHAPDVYDTAAYVLTSLTPLAILHGVQLQFAPDVDPEAGWRAVGLRPKLERIFFNLLENAIWHSPSNGRITIVLKREPGGIYVAITDEGKGVQAHHVPNLFQKFSKGEHKTGKVGLGLYFCRITVEQWGGTIGYHPQEAGGSVFWFRLPGAGALVEDSAKKPHPADPE